MVGARWIYVRSFICGVLLSVAAWADPVVADDVVPADSGRFCPLGQVWPGYDPDWIEAGVISGGGQTFSTLIEPAAGCACSLGYQTSTLDFFMAFAEGAQPPLTVTVSLGWQEAVADPSGQLAWLPGDVLCETPVRAFTFDIPKPYVGFGIALDCECAAIERPAFLFFTIHSTLDPPGGLYTTGSGNPALNRNLTLVDGIWVDLAAAGILTRGNLVVSGFAQCCELPVAPLTKSWGDLKARYR